MKQYYAVIDTNVLVSALLASTNERPSAPAKIFDLILDFRIIPLYNHEILKEYEDVLKREKFKFPEEAINSVLKAIIGLGIESGQINSNEIFPDPKDLVFYEVALSTEDSYLITGNIRHFPVKRFIVTPAQMLQIIDNMA